MAVSDMVNLSGLLDEAKCFELVRQHRWPNGVRCPDCGSAVVIRNGHDEGQRHRQRYLCKACHTRFDDLTGTVLFLASTASDFVTGQTINVDGGFAFH